MDLTVCHATGNTPLIYVWLEAFLQFALPTALSSLTFVYRGLCGPLRSPFAIRVTFAQPGGIRRGTPAHGLSTYERKIPFSRLFHLFQHGLGPFFSFQRCRAFDHVQAHISPARRSLQTAAKHHQSTGRTPA